MPERKLTRRGLLLDDVEVINSSKATVSRRISWLIVTALVGLGWVCTPSLRNPVLAGASVPTVSTIDAVEYLASDRFSKYPLPPDENSTTCPQAKPLSSTLHAELEQTLFTLYDEEIFRLWAYEALGGAIRIPTESYDDLLPVGQDPRWDVFQDLHEYLATSFPLVFETLRATKVNTYGIVLHWQGSDSSLKPVLLTAHQDVVPVEPVTVDQWVYPPYSGYYDGTWIWGRGSNDDKADLISQIITINTLLDHGFKPQRTVVIAWGIDEEASGFEGAGHLGPYLEQTYGQDSFAMLVDEGGAMTADPVSGTVFAAPHVSEKGYLDVRIEVNVKGGHSSVPPAHTGIGILSTLLTHIEANPHPPHLGWTSTPLRETLCSATYSHVYPPALRKLALKAGASDDDELLEALMHKLIEFNPRTEATLSTTQATDLIWGGVKVNALPERATAVVDHRIAEYSSVEELEDSMTSLLAPLVASFNLSLIAFPESNSQSSPANHPLTPSLEESAGTVILSDAWGNRLEPSPIAPTGESGPWKLLSGTIKATIEATSNKDTGEQKKAVVVPGLSIGNTDTRFYWPLTQHIFRYSHRSDTDTYGEIHTVNEAIRAEAIIDEIKFFTKLILNMDETKLFD